MAHFIHDEKNNRIEGLSKEEIYALLAAAIQQGQLPSVDADTAFVTMFKSIVDGKAYKMAFCTQAQYNELEAQGELVADALYIITDDSTFSDWDTIIIDLQQEMTDFEAEVRTAIDTGLRYKITSFQCAFDFTFWNISTVGSFNAGAEIVQIDLKNSSNYGNNQVNILPTGCNGSIAAARVEYVSGDNDYITYSLDTINSNLNYITFTARNSSSGTIYTPNNNSGTTAKSTTFRLYIKDIYNNEFTQEFTINFKV